MECVMPGRYPEAEDRDEQAANADSVVIDMQQFRKSRKIVEYDTNANQRPRPTGGSGAGARNEPVE
jgi:hypothetical protein